MLDGKSYDVVVIGGGHAGCEAAAISARMGAATLLLTHKVETIGEMSCNPAIGGLGKGHLVREIDALGGVMGLMADQAGIQFRLLNRRKGPAVQGPRAQIDRNLYRQAMQKSLREIEGLTILAEPAADIIQGNGRLIGVETEKGTKISCGALVITTGTFLRGEIHLGGQRIPAGRVGEAPSIGLANSLYGLGLRMGRLKTGTPARLNGHTVDWRDLEVQPGDDVPTPFSFMTTKISQPQVPCHITYTNVETHRIIEANLHQSPMYSGQIESVGPRYCPSIEDKIHRFADKSSHQIFLEPEGLDDPTIYPNGISTSLPEEVQEKFIRSIKGLEKVEILQPGYAIEYDHVDPRELLPSLETKTLKGLFLAGQINGTTGYEEAAGQGLLAGINAAKRAASSDSSYGPFLVTRSEGYLGVMIDDLVTRGVTEPYRMFTSRAEYRLTLRADNADLRLTPKAMALGVLTPERAKDFSQKRSALDAAMRACKTVSVSPNVARKHGLKVNQDGRKRSPFELLAYADIQFDDLLSIWPELEEISPRVREQIEIEAQYAGYMDRQEADILAFQKDEAIHIPADFDYGRISGLRTELKNKLEATRPATLGQAGRIEGMTPAALILLLGFLKKDRSRAAEAS